VEIGQGGEGAPGRGVHRKSPFEDLPGFRIAIELFQDQGPIGQDRPDGGKKLGSSSQGPFGRVVLLHLPEQKPQGIEDLSIIRIGVEQRVQEMGVDVVVVADLRSS